MRPRHLLPSACVALLVAGAGTPSVAGDPPLWDAAREPRLARDLRALRVAEQLYLQARDPAARSSLLLRQAVLALEGVDANSSPDPRVRFFYGRLLSRVGRDGAAVDVLRRAIDHAPHHPSVNEARFALAVSFARLGRTQEEIETYEAWLEEEPSPKHRAIGLTNQAEGLMASGQIDDAVRTYRRAVELSHDNALAHWGLAVALDRSGDPAGALHAAHIALTYDPDARELNSENVFFIPAHDRFWYRALGAMARASSSAEPSLRALWWDRASLLWQQYIDASPADGHWVPVARIRLHFCERKTQEARVRAGSRKALPPRTH